MAIPADRDGLFVYKKFCHVCRKVYNLGEWEGKGLLGITADSFAPSVNDGTFPLLYMKEFILNINSEAGADWYEQLRIWPQTHICYIETDEGIFVAELVSRMPFLPEKYCCEFPASIQVKWEFNEENNQL